VKRTVFRYGHNKPLNFLGTGLKTAELRVKSEKNGFFDTPKQAVSPLSHKAAAKDKASYGIFTFIRKVG
jgi:hypothetical protein